MGYKPKSVISKPVSASSFRPADTNHGNGQTSPLSDPLMIRVVLAEEKNIIWFCFKGMWWDSHLNSVPGLVKIK